MNFFNNESEVERIGNMQFENRLDRVTVSGDLDIICCKAGQVALEAFIRRLKDVAAEMQKLADKGQLPENLATAKVSASENIFGLPAPRDSHGT